MNIALTAYYTAYTQRQIDGYCAKLEQEGLVPPSRIKAIKEEKNKVFGQTLNKTQEEVEEAGM